MDGFCLLLSTALFVVARRPVIVDDVALVLPAASTLVVWCTKGGSKTLKT